jgi:phage terminase large subunit-like protein
MARRPVIAAALILPGLAVAQPADDAAKCWLYKKRKALPSWASTRADPVMPRPTAMGRRGDRAFARIVAEVNFGGGLVEALLRAVDPNIPFKPVHASRGKIARAEPVSAL